MSGSTRLVALAVGMLAATLPVSAADRLLEEVVGFTGSIGFLESGAPGFLLAVVRDEETAFAGFGETVKGNGQEPHADTIMRIGSISKAFCGMTLASLVSDNLLTLTDPVQNHLRDLTVPSKDGRLLRVIDIATQSSGLPREVPRADAPDDNPFVTNDHAAHVAGLAGDPFLFAPGTGILYSNWGFDLLGMALAGAGAKPYAELLSERVLDPLGMTSTSFNPDAGESERMMQGHFIDGSPMPFVPTPQTIECSGGLQTTANDMLKFMTWHLERSQDGFQSVRLLDHAAWLYRDGLDTVVGMDEAGPMDAMGLGWVIMLPEGDRPLILHKTGGLQGMLAYVAIAPSRGVGVFAAMNEFNFAGYGAIVTLVNGLVSELAPR